MGARAAGGFSLLNCNCWYLTSTTTMLKRRYKCWRWFLHSLHLGMVVNTVKIWTEEPSVLELKYEWSLGQHLARGWSSTSSPTSAGTEASRAPTAQAGKDKQKRCGQGGINAGRKHLS